MKIKDDTTDTATRQVKCRGPREESKEAAQSEGRSRERGQDEKMEEVR